MGGCRKRRPVGSSRVPCPVANIRDHRHHAPLARATRPTPAPVVRPCARRNAFQGARAPNTWQVAGAGVAPAAFLPTDRRHSVHPPIAACLLGSGGDAIASFKIDPPVPQPQFQRIAAVASAPPAALRQATRITRLHEGRHGHRAFSVVRIVEQILADIMARISPPT